MIKLHLASRLILRDKSTYPINEQEKSDPFIQIAHGKKCAAIIPHADSLWLDNMGHDLPDQLSGVITRKMILNFNRKL
jgi:hypothetical protein